MAWRLFDEGNSSDVWDAIVKRLRGSFIEASEASDQLRCIDETETHAARGAAGGGKKDP